MPDLSSFFCVSRECSLLLQCSFIDTLYTLSLCTDAVLFCYAHSLHNAHTAVSCSMRNLGVNLFNRCESRSMY